MTDKDLSWAKLTNEAKNVLEHLIGIHDERINEITIELGQRPYISSGEPRRYTNQVVGPKLFDEIRRYVDAHADDYATLDLSDSSMKLELAPGVLSADPASPKM